MLTGEWRALRHSGFAMLTIGIVFVAIVHGPILPTGPFPPRQFWQIPPTYTVVLAAWNIRSSQVAL